MNIEHLNYLITVADCGSIHEASRQLLFKQQYLSNVVKSLEEHFGTQIFERRPRGVVPTANGQFLIDTARQIIALYNTMENDFAYPDNQQSQDCHETINIYTSSNYLDAENFLVILETFKQYFPNVQLSLISKSTGNLFSTLYEEPTSLALYPTHVATDVFSQTLPADLTFQILESIPLGVLTSVHNKAAQNYTTITIKEALTLPLIFLAPQDLTHAPIYQAKCSYGKPNVQYIVDNPALLLRLLKKENWYTITKQHALSDDPSILSIPFQEPISLNLLLVYHKEAPQSYTLRSLIRFLRTAQSHLLE